MKNELNYRLFFYPAKDIAIKPHDGSYDQVIKAFQNPRISKNIRFFYRYIRTGDNRGYCIDKDNCYLGDILYFDDVKPEQVDSYITVQNNFTDAEIKNSVGYAVIRDGGNIILPDSHVKVFNKNMDLLNRHDPDGLEELVFEMMLAEKRAIYARKRLEIVENKTTSHIVSEIAKNYYKYRN